MDVTDFSPSWAFGAGDAIGTAADLVTWAKALWSGALLDPAMHSEQLEFVPNDATPYGLGIRDVGGLIGHNGQISGYMSQAGIRAIDGAVIVVLTNVTQAPDLRLPATVLSDVISEAIPPG